MKLDRNVNPDGRGKYALINLRTNKVEWGGDGGDQFFVMKYKDRFTGPALRAYARACRAFALLSANKDEWKSFSDFADEIDREAAVAEKVGMGLPS